MIPWNSSAFYCPWKHRSFGLNRWSAWVVTLGSLLQSLFFAVSFSAAQDSSTIGQWSPTVTWPYQATHANILPTGKVMWWPPFKDGDNPTLWDPSTSTNTALVKVGVNIFASGHAFLPGGQLLVAGGHISDYAGLPNAYTYDSSSSSWTRRADMNNARWYPTVTTLPSGDMLVISGWINTGQGVDVEPQVWQKATASWRNLSAAHLALPFYPFMFVAPNGKVFCAGPGQTTQYLDTSGTGSWSVVGNSNFGTRNWGSPVMYDDGKVLVIGGTPCGAYAGSSNCTTPPTATAEVIDLTSSSPAWKYTGSMAGGRKLHNATLLADGKVLVTGGTRGTEDPNTKSSNPAYPAELWDPATGTWSTMASLNVYRAYHATALLLPDGRVLSAGGVYGGPSAEIYSPPYLFKGSRPTISSAPTSITYGRSFFIGTPNATSISKVTMIALGSVTHSVNMGQRISRPAFSQASGGLNVTAPSNPNTTPPGYYMLFILNSSGVPSVAKIVQITGTNPPPTPTPTPTPTPPPAAPSNLTATALSPSQVKLSWTDNSNNETVFKIERSTDGTTFTQVSTVASSITTYSDSGLTEYTTYYYRIRAYNSGGNSGYSNSVSVAIAPPAAPTNLTASAASATQVNLSWTDNSNNEIQFKIERSVDAGITFNQIATVGANVTTYADTGLAPLTAYFYRVRASNFVGDSAYSNTANAVTLP